MANVERRAPYADGDRSSESGDDTGGRVVAVAKKKLPRSPAQVASFAKVRLAQAARRAAAVPPPPPTAQVAEPEPARASKPPPLHRCAPVADLEAAAAAEEAPVKARKSRADRGRVRGSYLEARGFSKVAAERPPSPPPPQISKLHFIYV